MLAGEPIKIDGFGKRLEWAMTNCEFDATFLGLNGAPVKDMIRSIKELGYFVRLLLNRGDGYPSEQNWRKYMSGKVAVGHNVIDAVLTIFPSMPKSLLVSGTIRDFEDATTNLLEGRDLWISATSFVERRRGYLADMAKKYYANIDATPRFPVITDKGWVLEKLQPVNEDDEPCPFMPHIARQKGQELPQWIGTYTYIKKLRMGPEGRARLWNGDMFRVMEVVAKDGKLDFKLAPGGFYEYIDTCEVLGAELANHLLQHENQNPSADDVPMRGEPENAFNLWTRMVPLGVSCLCIMKNYPLDNGKVQDVFLMHERGKKTTAGQNTWHVAPAGGHAPVSMSDKDPRQRTIWSTVVREFVEECFDIEDAQKMAKSYDDLMHDKNVKPIVDNFFRQDGVAKIFLMGVGLDPVTMALDAMVAIVIDWEKADRGDWNALPNIKHGGLHLRMVHSYEAKDTRFVPLTGPDSFLSEINRADGKTVHPAGQACLIQGARFYQDLMSSV